MHPGHFVNYHVLWVIEARVVGDARAAPDSHEPNNHESYQRRNEQEHRRRMSPQHRHIDAQADATKKEKPNDHGKTNGMRQNRNRNSDKRTKGTRRLGNEAHSQPSGEGEAKPGFRGGWGYSARVGVVPAFPI